MDGGSGVRGKCTHLGDRMDRIWCGGELRAVSRKVLGFLAQAALCAVRLTPRGRVEPGSQGALGLPPVLKKSFQLDSRYCLLPRAQWLYPVSPSTDRIYFFTDGSSGPTLWPPEVPSESATGAQEIFARLTCRGHHPHVGNERASPSPV